MTYQEYLRYINSSDFHVLAEAVKTRYGYHCAICDDPGPLEAHRRTYRRLGREELTDLIALCPACHKLFTEHHRLPVISSELAMVLLNLGRWIIPEGI